MTGYLLDTSTLIDVLKSRLAVRSRLAQLATDALVGASIISGGELMIGAYKLQGPGYTQEEFLSEFDRANTLLADLAVYPVTHSTTLIYGQIQAELLRRGRRKLTINDGWIAATALEHGLTLVTSDERLKGLGDILRVEDWRG